MTDKISKIETFIVTIDRDTPYLGPLAEGEFVNQNGYIVRKGNGTIYPNSDRSVLVKMTTTSGLVGWGETYGICAPKAVCEIISDLLTPVLLGRNPMEVEALWDTLYDLMRVRGFYSGFYVDAIAALDIGMWDLAGKIQNKPLVDLLGDRHHQRIPAYISGLPAPDISSRAKLAAEWAGKGFSAIKFAAAVSHEGIENELALLRQTVGPEVDLMVDLHWKFSAEEAIDLIKRLEPYSLAFAEAPVKPEDMDGLLTVARSVDTPIAAGEEWRTEYEALPRLRNSSVNIVQPEMGHTGVTQFLRIARLAEQYGCRVAPHATIGLGIFMAASLHASATVKSLWVHEYQHSIFDRNLTFLEGDMDCNSDGYIVPIGIGLGVEPNQTIWKHTEQYS